MQIRFIGPIGRVTGSCYHLRHGDHELLVDCGLRQEGIPGDETWNSGVWSFDPRRLTAVILTHAHIDHSGLIPRLVRDGFAGTVYASQATCRLARHLLRDAVNHGAPYTAKDISRIRFRAVADGRLSRIQPIATDLFLVFHRAGHILGSVSPQIIWGPPNGEQRSISFSGDLGPNVDRERMQALARHPGNPYVTKAGGVPFTQS